MGATVAYFMVGGILFSALPSLQQEFLKYPAVFRAQDDMMRVMPMGMISILVGIFVVGVLYARGGNCHQPHLRAGKSSLT